MNDHLEANVDAGPSWDLETVAELVGELHRAAWTAEWDTALRGLADRLGVAEVRIVVQGSRGWEVAIAAGTRPSRRRSLQGLSERPLALWLEPRPGPALEPLVRVIEDQLTAVLRLAGRRHDDRAREAATRAALDRLEIAVVLVDERGGVAQCNRAAAELLDREPALRIGPAGGLEADSPEVQRRLARIVARMVGASHDPASRLSEHLEVPREGTKPLRLLAVPLHGGAELTGRACAVFLSDPDAGVVLPEEVLRRHYGLTHAESRVAARLLRGLGADGVAQELGVTRETVRSHIKRLYAKIGTTRQCDLVALVLRGPAGVRWD